MSSAVRPACQFCVVHKASTPSQQPHRSLARQPMDLLMPLDPAGAFRQAEYVPLLLLAPVLRAVVRSDVLAIQEGWELGLWRLANITLTASHCPSELRCELSVRCTVHRYA